LNHLPPSRDIPLGKPNGGYDDKRFERSAAA
jgi:hypothetical protein